MKVKENRKMKNSINEDMLTRQKGITLIVLVITIIILLILAGVTINMALGDNGLFSKSKEAVQKYKDADEKEAIQLALATGEILKNLDAEESDSIGIKLYDKTVENGSKWNIIVMNDGSKKTYGTGYTFLEKGSELPGYGKINKAWLISDSTSEMIELEDNEYTNLSFGEGLGTTNGLMFNLDSSIIEGNNSKVELEKALGNNVELINFDWSENSGVNNGTFILDGVDDYIRVKLDEEGKSELGQRRIYI